MQNFDSDISAQWHIICYVYVWLVPFFFQFYRYCLTQAHVSQAERNDSNIFLPHLNCCNCLFTSLSKASLNHLQVLQNAAAKLSTRSLKMVHLRQICVHNFFKYLLIHCHIFLLHSIVIYNNSKFFPFEMEGGWEKRKREITQHSESCCDRVSQGGLQLQLPHSTSMTYCREMSLPTYVNTGKTNNYPTRVNLF